MEDFLSLGLPEQLVDSLKLLNFNTPTPVQAKVIPIALTGADILATAQTGTGKTGAFGIPLISKLLSNPKSMALVLAPTRELALQVSNMLRSLLGKKSAIKAALLIGGDSMHGQLHQLRSRPRLIVGTPGRINDHLMRGTLNLSSADFVVLDETDRMLDMGFAPQIERIVGFLPAQRQTLLLSATLPKNIMSLAERYLNKPVRIAIAATNDVAANLKQEIVFVSESEKQNQLHEQLGKRDGSIIIFVKTKMGAERMAKTLRQDEHSADAIHGDLSHNRRQRVIKDFRDSKYRIMVATDIAARGLDISHVQHVINYDLPQCPEDYIHRVGRTARAGAEGSALCFVTPSDKRKWNAINELLNPGTKSAFEGKFKSGKDSSGRDSRRKPPSRAGGGFNKSPRNISNANRSPFGGEEGRFSEGGAKGRFSQNPNNKSRFSENNGSRFSENNNRGGRGQQSKFGGESNFFQNADSANSRRKPSEFNAPRKSFSGKPRARTVAN